MDNFNRRGIDTSKVFDEVYNINKRDEINKKNYIKSSDFRKKMFNLDNLDKLKKQDSDNNTVESRVNNLNKKINTNKSINNSIKNNNFIGKFK